MYAASLTSPTCCVPCHTHSQVNRTIQAVNLEWNNIGDDAQEAIAHALKLNTSVKECTWDRCADTLTSEDCVRIAEAQKINHYDDIPKHQF